VGGGLLAAFFLLAAVASLRSLLRRRPFLVIDRSGIRADDARGRPVSIAWEELVSVTCPRGFRRRGVLLGFRPARGEKEREILVPADRLGGAPPQWLAALIETYRTRTDLRARLGERAPG
jgi:hypothetical protein